MLLYKNCFMNRKNMHGWINDNCLLLGHQAIFLQKVEILSVTTKRKKIEVSGGFYSEEDMKKELGYKETLECIKHICSMTMPHAFKKGCCMCTI